MQILFTFFGLLGWVSNINNQCKQASKKEAAALAGLRYLEPILLLTIFPVLWCFHRKVMKLATRGSGKPNCKEKWFIISWFQPKSCGPIYVHFVASLKSLPKI